MSFFDVIWKMIDTVLVGGLTIGYGGLPLSQAIFLVFISYAPYYLTFCLIVWLTYYTIHKMKER